MKRLGVIIFLPLMLWGQPEFFGYFESQASIMQVGGNNYGFGFNKLRLDVEARPNDNVLIGANINIQRYWGKTIWNVYDFIPGYADMGKEMNIELPDTILLDNVYMKLSVPLFDLTVGRQQISTGVGYAWNPTDIFNSKSLMDPSYEQTGVSAIRFEAPFGDRVLIDAIIQPNENWDKSTKQIWVKSGLGGFDFSVSVAEYKWQTIRSILYEYGLEDTRRLLGGSVVGEILGLGFWLEIAYNDIEYLGAIPPLGDQFIFNEAITFNETVVGVDHTFDNSLYVLGEYVHNENGIAKKEEIQIYHYLNSLAGVSHNLMQDYGFLYIMHPTFDFTTLSAIVFVNINDDSGIFSPMVDWNIFEDTNISLQGSYSWGVDDTEFGLQDWGLILNVTSNF